MIRIEVPFRRCQKCQHFIANTHFSKSYANDELIGLETIISCSNQDLCKLLYSEAEQDLKTERGSVDLLEILKHGASERQSIIFTCKRCGCVYVATEKEAIRDKDVYGGLSWVSFCPDCGYMNRKQLKNGE